LKRQKGTRKSEKTRRQRRNRLIYGSICLTIVAILVSSYVLLHSTETPFNPNEKKALIIDGLSTTHENKTFWWTVQAKLKHENYTTHYCQGGGASDTVNYYRDLPTKGYEIIILRVHSAINLENGELAIFTNEKWSDTKASTTYLNDIINDRLARVRVEENSTSYFGITPNFVKAMNGRFENTIIIMMGCDGMKTQSLAEAFIQKGAKVYIGWDGPVVPEYIDVATIELLEHLVLEKQTVSHAIEKTVEEVGRDPYYQSTLRYYP